MSSADDKRRIKDLDLKKVAGGRGPTFTIRAPSSKPNDVNKPKPGSANKQP
jgi:hypothetical protein